MCPHDVFQCSASIAKLTETEGGPTTSYSAEISIRCTVCKTEFEFIGLPMGSSPHKPMVNVDCTELRAPIKPKGATDAGTRDVVLN